MVLEETGGACLGVLLRKGASGLSLRGGALCAWYHTVGSGQEFEGVGRRLPVQGLRERLDVVEEARVSHLCA